MSGQAKNLRRHIQVLKDLEGKKIESGWFASNVYADGTKVAFVAKVNEFGAVIQRPSNKGPVRQIIPPRPMMRRASIQIRRKRKELEKRLAKMVFSGKISPEQVPEQIGEFMKQQILESIDSGVWTPNAESTERQKGFNRPLIGKTGTLADSVQSIVSEEGK